MSDFPAPDPTATLRSNNAGARKIDKHALATAIKIALTTRRAAPRRAFWGMQLQQQQRGWGGSRSNRSSSSSSSGTARKQRGLAGGARRI